MRLLVFFILTAVASHSYAQEKQLPENFDFGQTGEGVYSNDFFDFEMKFNPDWIVQSQEQFNQLADMGKELVAGDDENMKAAVKAGMVKTAYLLAVFKHEVGAPVDFNPSFIVVAENMNAAPGVKNGKDYLFHVKKMFQSTQMNYNLDNEVYEKTLDGTTFHVLEASLDMMGTKMTQEYICTISKGFSLSIIISYMNDADRDELHEIVNSFKSTN